MLDIKWIRQHPNQLDDNLKRRHQWPCSERILELDITHRQLLNQLQELQTERNDLAKRIGQAKAQGQDAEILIQRANIVKEEIPTLEQKAAEIGETLANILMELPNLLLDDVPAGEDAGANVCVQRWGAPQNFSFEPKEHEELGLHLDGFDFQAAARMSGARFVVMKGVIARLHRALTQFMLDVHTQEFNYQEINPPLLVYSPAMYGTGQLPKFAQDSFQTQDERWLIPTSEVVLTNLVREEILHEADLPIRFVAHTPCFRSEAGSAGRDTRGIIRQHQFEKVELVSITTPEASQAEHDRMCQAAETILQRLDLTYRTMVLCGGDTGTTAAKTYDIEVWLPSEQGYREISSCSNALSYQARRMNARYRLPDGGLDFVHTLNGSGLAVGRALVAVMENYQQADGSIIIPDVLQKYMNMKVIECPNN